MRFEKPVEEIQFMLLGLVGYFAIYFKIREGGLMQAPQ